MKWMKYIMMLLVGVAFISCSRTTAVYNDYTSDININKYDTYTWLKGDQIQESGSNELSEWGLVLFNETNEQMNRRGFIQDETDPDLIVNSQVWVTTDTQEVVVPEYGVYDYFFPGIYTGPWKPYYEQGDDDPVAAINTDTDKVEYVKTIVIIDLMDAETLDIVWRGWAVDGATYIENFDRMDTYAKNIFNDFPIEPVKVQF